MKTTQAALDASFMMECLSLAQQGAGTVSPNPMVGCVIVKNGKVIGHGYHKAFGGPHAEVHAFRSAKSSARGATLYVNLEPCNYYGKTPPCTDLIIKNGISRVVIGMLDPNPRVAGNGVRQLRKAKIKVDVGILQSEGTRLNESFTKYITTGVPFVTVKIAQTLDGFIADANGKSKWITNEESRTLVHTLRAQTDAVLVGAQTVISDNPLLTVRDVKGRNPVRIVLDGKFSIPENASILNDSNAIIIVSTSSAKRFPVKKEKLMKKGIKVIDLPANRNGVIPTGSILRELGSLGISSVLVEGGSSVFSQFLRERTADKVLAFIAPKLFGRGLHAVAELENLSYNNYIHLTDVCSWNMNGDVLIEGYLKKK
jgi:diaminohydroxyphosphoribosylaminopyrimidine deaminase / 5-amino-6-(5-phosphoribosylamino)uracil reductase